MYIMPNRKTLKRSQQRKRNKASPGALIQSAAPNPWAYGGVVTELKSYFSSDDANRQLYHTIPVLLFNNTSLFEAIVQGTSGSTRVGARVHPVRLSVNMICNTKLARSNVSYRVSAIVCPATSATDTFSEHFSGGSFTSHHIPSSSTLLHDAFWPVNQGSTQSAATQERSSLVSFSVNLNHPIVYDSTGFCQTRLIVFVIAYDAYGTLTTDNIASIPSARIRIDYTDA